MLQQNMKITVSGFSKSKVFSVKQPIPKFS